MKSNRRWIMHLLILWIMRPTQARRRGSAWASSQHLRVILIQVMIVSLAQANQPRNHTQFLDVTHNQCAQNLTVFGFSRRAPRTSMVVLEMPRTSMLFALKDPPGCSAKSVGSAKPDGVFVSLWKELVQSQVETSWMPYQRPTLSRFPRLLKGLSTYKKQDEQLMVSSLPP